MKTHLVAVNAFLIKENRFLLLKRNNPPLIWGPPGGRLQVDENPEQGLKREIKEETNLEVDVIMPVTTWFGNFNNRKTLAVDYLCLYKSGEIQLSDEHEDYQWMTLEELKQRQDEFFISEYGFKLEDFELAWKIYAEVITIKPNSKK